MEQIYFAPWEYKSYGKDVHIYEYCTILNPKKISIGDYTRIDSRVRLEAGEGLTIGERVHIADSAIINTGGGTTIIGNHAGIAAGAKIISGQPDLTFLHITPNELPENVHPLRYTTTIGEYAFVCVGAIINPGVTLGRGAVAAAGAVVTHDIPDMEIWAGVPARKIGDRELVAR